MLSPKIIKQLARLGVAPPAPSTSDAVTVLVRELVWPSVTFVRRPDTDGPLICGLRFLPPDSRGQFWDGWEQHFASVDPKQLFPLACDDYNYHFIATNAADPFDPLVYSVDHEETNAEPYDGRFRTVSELLSVMMVEAAVE